MAFDIGHVTLGLFVVYNLKVKIGMSDSDRERVVYIFVTSAAVCMMYLLNIRLVQYHFVLHILHSMHYNSIITIQTNKCTQFH
jgi:hypothetical protein